MSLKLKIPFLVVVFVLCANAQELLKNNDFLGGLEGWGSPSIPQGTVTAVKTKWGGGLSFEVQNGGTNSWDIQMTQSGINLRPGYTYKISVKAHANSGTRKILVGIGEGGGEYLSYIEFECNLVNDLGEFVSSWENSNTSNENARFFVNGGGENVGFTIVSLSVLESKTPGGDPNDEFVLVNQVGYYTNGAKIASVRNGKDETYKIMKDGSEVWSGKPSSPIEYQPSKESLRVLDFSDLQQEGTFTFTRDGNAVSREFTIAKAPAQEISKAALRAYYYQRASMEITEAHGGIWNRPLGHPDNVVHRHSSTNESGTFASEKGWYDAGDYGKYIVNSGISTYTLMMLYEHFPKYHDGLSLNIPESKNDLADILDEAKWNIDWMLTMQGEDGGVYHKLTTLQFETDKIMPHECSSDRYVYMKSTAATLNFAAVMAKASVVYVEFDKEFASQCKAAAEKAFAWAKANPKVVYVQPGDVATGIYGDSYLDDEFYWAASELQVATESDEYESYLTNLPDTIRVPDWQYTGALGLFTIAANKPAFDSSVVNKACDYLMTLANTLVQNQKCGYNVSMKSPTTDFVWGSNGMAANQGVVLLHAFYLTREDKYLDAAVSQLDYLLGRNPLGICYVTGFGQKSPLNPHHRIMNSDGIAAPIPGFLVGGPHKGGNDVAEMWGCQNYVKEDANSYIDHFCSYATNEVTINWNASFSYLSNSLEALYASEKVEMFDWGNPIIEQKKSASSHHGIAYYEIANNSKLKFKLNLTSGKNSHVKFSVFNLAGKRVFSETVARPSGEFEMVLDKKQIGRGVFVLSVLDGNVKLNCRFIVK